MIFFVRILFIFVVIILFHFESNLAILQVDNIFLHLTKYSPIAWKKKVDTTINIKNFTLEIFILNVVELKILIYNSLHIDVLKFD